MSWSALPAPGSAGTWRSPAPKPRACVPSAATGISRGARLNPCGWTGAAMSAESRQAATIKTILGFGVHIFTATGAALGLLALLAAERADWPLMFMLLGAALVVDGVDGTLARPLDVA